MVVFQLAELSLILSIKALAETQVTVPLRAPFYSLGSRDSSVPMHATRLLFTLQACTCVLVVQ